MYQDQLKLYCIDLKTGKELGVIQFDDQDWSSQVENLENARLYVERFEEQILVAIVNDNGYYSREEATIYEIDISELEEELWGENVGAYLTSFLIRKGSPLYLDAEHTWVYPCVQTEWKSEPRLEIAPYKFTKIAEKNPDEAGTEESESQIINTENEVLELLVLDDGKVVITAEQIQDTTDVDLYIYQWNGEEMVRQILYKNAGYIYSLQYDPEYHRLMAVTDDEYRATYQALILEFAN